MDRLGYFYCAFMEVFCASVLPVEYFEDGVVQFGPIFSRLFLEGKIVSPRFTQKLECVDNKAQRQTQQSWKANLGT